MAISLGRGYFTVGLAGDLKDQVNQAAQHMTQQFAAAARTVGMAFTAIGGAITGGLALSVKAFTDAQNVTAQLDAVLKSTAGAAGMTRDALIKLAEQFQKTTTYEDETVLAAENVLLTFTSIGNTVFPQAMAAALDMSTALGTDLQSSVIMIGKALQDPIVGMTALRRVGVNVTGMLRDQVTALVESGDIMGAQKVILAELGAEFGGSAAAAAQTFTGHITQLKNTFGDLQEIIGEVIVTQLQKFATDLRPIVEAVIEWTQQNPALTESIVLFAVAVGGAMLVLGPLLLVLPGILAAVGALLTPFGALAALLLGGVVVAFVRFRDEFISGLGRVNEALMWAWSNVIEPVWGWILSAFETGRAWIKKNWDAIAQTFRLGADIIKAALQIVWDIVVLVFEMIGLTVMEGIGAVTDSFDTGGKSWIEILNMALGVFRDAMQWLSKKMKEVREFFEEHWYAMGQAIHFFAEAIVTPLTTAIDVILALAGAVSWLASVMPPWLLDLITMSGFEAIDRIGDMIGGGGEEPRSKGGRVETGNTYRVGEHGPELFFNDRGNYSKLIGRQGTERVAATQDGWIVNNRMLRAVSHIYRTLYPESNQKTERDRATRRLLDDYGFPHIYPGTVSTWLADQFSKNEMFTKVMAAELGYRKSGGPVSANRPYIVGEAGPELFIPKAAGDILNRSQMGQTVSFNAPLVHVAQMNASNPADVNALAQRLGDELRRRLSARGLQPNFGV